MLNNGCACMRAGNTKMFDTKYFQEQTQVMVSSDPLHPTNSKQVIIKTNGCTYSMHSFSQQDHENLLQKN